MQFLIFALLAIPANAVTYFNLTVDNPKVLYPNTMQDEFMTKCYPDVGCFYTGPPWYHPLYRPISVPPSDDITTTYLLYTQRNPKEFFIFYPCINNLRASGYGIGKPVTVIVHGYEKNYTALLAIKDELLAYEDRNVFVIDWSRAASFPYYQACADARVVAARIANTLRFLMENAGLTPNNIHVIGKSLGGQLIAYIGQGIEKLGRLTGLDPAGPYFQNVHEDVRLDMGDAVFVDTIRSNVGTDIYTGEGVSGNIGHADFYPNGGSHQPGCDYEQFLGLKITMAKHMVGNECSHDGSQRYFASSVRKCFYKATACSSYQGYKNGICDEQVTNRMGLFATKPDQYPLRYYIDTERSSPYCEVNK